MLRIPALSVSVNLDPIRPIPNIRVFLLIEADTLDDDPDRADHIIDDFPVCRSPIISSL